MRNWDWDTIGGFATIAFLILLFGFGIFYLFRRGDLDRIMSNVSRDATTSKDEIYQTGSVRVYKFTNDGITCFLADKQGMSASIWCK